MDTHTESSQEDRDTVELWTVSPSFLLSSSVVANPLSSFCLGSGGGVGGNEAGGVGGLLRLF